MQNKSDSNKFLDWGQFHFFVESPGTKFAIKHLSDIIYGICWITTAPNFNAILVIILYFKGMAGITSLK